MKSVCIGALGMFLLGAGARAAEDGVTVRAIPRPAVSVPATGASQGILVSLVSVGLYDAAMPCFTCVNGATQSNLGIAQPLSWVQGGSKVTFTVVADDLAYSGPCSFIYSVRQGGPLGTVLLRGQANVPGGCYPAGWFASFNTRVPPNPGVYILEGMVDAGGAIALMTVPLTIQ
jgi:hypothetical protein